jgi:hypothetical protein
MLTPKGWVRHSGGTFSRELPPRRPHEELESDASARSEPVQPSSEQPAEETNPAAGKTGV